MVAIMSQSYDLDDPRYNLRKSFSDKKGQINEYAGLLPQLEIAPSYIERHLFGSLKAGKLLTMLMRSNFFEPTTKDIKPIASPNSYDFDVNTSQTAFDKKGELQLWISEPNDKSKGYVVYFEGMAGHFGDLGVPKLAIDHNKAAKKLGKSQSADTFAENREYRIRRIKSLQNAGYGVIAVHLPGFGASKGTPTQENYYKAIDEALIPWLAQKSNDIDFGNLTILGASLGAASATHMAETLSRQGWPPKLLTLVTPPLSAADSILDAEPHDATDLLKQIGLRNQESIIQDRFAIAPMMAEISTNTKILVVGAGKDWWIPDHHVRMVAKAAQRSQHETREVHDPNAEHTTISPEWIVANIDAFNAGQPAIDPRAIDLPDSSVGYTANINTENSRSR